jgi:signal transduction histidine kinase
MKQRLWDPRLLDAAAVLGCLFLTVLAVKASWSDLPRPVIGVAGTLGSLAQWRRRQWPLVAAIAGSAAYALSGNPGPWAVGVYSGGSYARRRWLWLVALIGWAGSARLAWSQAGRLTANDVAATAVATTLAVGLGLFTATRRELAESWRDQAVRAAAERTLRDEQARAAERTRIAREMHDVLAHKVSLIAVHAGALELTATDESARVRDSAALIRVTARGALQELRYVLGILRESTQDGPLGDVGELVRSATEAGQHVDLRDPVGPLPPATARVVHRIVQEGLTNARKHAPGATVSVTLERTEGGPVTVTVTNGPAAHEPMDLPSSGAGLIGLAERVRLVGGTLESGTVECGTVENGTGSSGPVYGGWRLRATVPWLDHAVVESTVERAVEEVR